MGKLVVVAARVADDLYAELSREAEALGWSIGKYAGALLENRAAARTAIAHQLRAGADSLLDQPLPGPERQPGPVVVPPPTKNGKGRQPAGLAPGMRMCLTELGGCGQVKAESEFHATGKWRSSICKDCDGRKSRMAAQQAKLQAQVDGKRFCITCQQIKPLTDFVPDKIIGGKLKQRNSCHDCEAERARARRAKSKPEPAES